MAINPSNNLNSWADYWYYQIGVNVIPFNTRNKKPILGTYEEWLTKPVPLELHEHWKRNNMFDKGMAIILGKVWHNAAKQGLYLWFIDLDNQKAIDEFCSRNGVTTSLRELAKYLIVEQHKDDLSRAHIFAYSTYPLHKKSSDNIQGNDIPKFEVKGLGPRYCILFSLCPQKRL